MSEPNLWNKFYDEDRMGLGIEPEYKLEKYREYAPKGKVLDIGCGNGRNALLFTGDGFQIEGVEISEVASIRCKEIFSSVGHTITIHNSDIKQFMPEHGEYAVIIAAWILNFFKKSEAKEIIQRFKKALKIGGIFYLGVFSTSDPKRDIDVKESNEIEENTYYRDESKMCINYFDKNEIESYFEDFSIICFSEELYLEGRDSGSKYRGIIEFLGKKIKD